MIPVLLARLAWPASLTRERAALSISHLLISGDQEVRASLRTWIAAQRLETLCVNGLLPLVRAGEEAGRTIIGTDELSDLIGRPSLLSHLLLKEIDRAYVLPTAFDGMHSDAAPVDFEELSDFSRHLTHCIQEPHIDRLEAIERDTRMPLRRQWAFEWERLMAQEIARPSAEALFAQRSSHDEYSPCWQPQLSEVYRSSYLRTLAFGVALGGIDVGTAATLAARMCPIDLDLWAVEPSPRPGWWPELPQLSGDLDTDPALVTETLKRTLLEGLPGDQVIAAACGAVSGGSAARKDLTVFSVFQRSEGALRPTSQQIYEWASGETCVVIGTSLLRFNGVVHPGDARVEALGDWAFYAATRLSHPIPVETWQAWRGVRGLAAPIAEMGSGTVSARCEADGVYFDDDEGVLGVWRDWTHHLSALFLADTLPSSGWVLTIRRDAVDQFAQDNKMSFASVWRLRSSFRKQTYDKWTHFDSFGDVGMSSVIRA